MSYWRNLEVLSSVEREILDGTMNEAEQEKVRDAFDLIRNAYDAVAAQEENQ